MNEILSYSAHSNEQEERCAFLQIRKKNYGQTEKNRFNDKNGWTKVFIVIIV